MDTEHGAKSGYARATGGAASASASGNTRHPVPSSPAASRTTTTTTTTTPRSAQSRHPTSVVFEDYLGALGASTVNFDAVRREQMRKRSEMEEEETIAQMEAAYVDYTGAASQQTTRTEHSRGGKWRDDAASRRKG